MAERTADPQTPSPALPRRTGRGSGGLTRGASLAIAATLFLVIVVPAAGNFYVEVLLQGTIDGTLLAAWLLGAFGYGRLALRRFADIPPGLRYVSDIALGLGVLGLLEAGLGFAGLLNTATAWAVIGTGMVMALYALRRHTLGDLRSWLAARSPAANVAWLWAVPVALGFVAASMAPGFLWKPLDPHPYDVLSYHLQIPREWYDAGRIIPLRHNSFSFFPMGMETHFLTAMHLRGGPWAAMYLCQFVSLAHGVLAALAVTAICRSMRVGPVVGTLAGVATLAVPWVLMLSSVCYVESGVMLYTLLAVAWATRAAGRLLTEREGHDAAAGAADSDAERASFADRSAAYATASDMLSSDRAISYSTRVVSVMALAGAFAGFACGMKYTAVAMTAVPLLVLWPLIAWRPLDWRRTAVAWLAGVVVCGLVFSPWFVRNAVTTGNPVFPLATNLFGPGHFTPDQIDRYRTAHTPPPAERPLPARLHAAWQRVVVDPQYGYVLVPAVIAAAGLAVARRRRDLLLPGLMLVAMAAVWLLATHLLARFLSPAIPLACVLIAVAVARSRFSAIAVATVFVAQIGVGLAWTWATLSAALPLGQVGLFRMSDMAMLETPETRAVRQSGQKVALIGDAQAFFYVVPSDRLLYRGVFDVTVPAGGNLVDAWHGRSVNELRRDGYWVVISTSELDRLSRTYAHLPKPVAPFDRVESMPTVLPPIR